MDIDKLYLIIVVLVMCNILGVCLGFIFVDLCDSNSWESRVVVGTLDGVSATNVNISGGAFGFRLIVDGVEYPVVPLCRERVGSGVVSRQFSFDEFRGLVGEKVMLFYEVNRKGMLRNGVLEVKSE